MASDDNDLRAQPSLEDEGIPDLEGIPEERVATGDTQEGMMPPRDHPVAAEDFGVTPAEEQLDEPLALRVRREQPDFGQPGYRPSSEDDWVGRLVEPESEIDEPDLTAESVASDTGWDSGGFTAEEAAMHVTEEP